MRRVCVLVTLAAVLTALASASPRRNTVPQTTRDYYKILGVPRDADIKAITKAWRKTASRLHPDHSKLPKEEAETKFSAAAEAYSVLSDVNKREEYDRYGHNGKPTNMYSGSSGRGPPRGQGGFGFPFGSGGPGSPGGGGGGPGSPEFDQFMNQKKGRPLKHEFIKKFLEEQRRRKAERGEAGVFDFPLREILGALFVNDLWEIRAPPASWVVAVNLFCMIGVFLYWFVPAWYRAIRCCYVFSCWYCCGAYADDGTESTDATSGSGGGGGGGRSGSRSGSRSGGRGSGGGDGEEVSDESDDSLDARPSGKLPRKHKRGVLPDKRGGSNGGGGRQRSSDSKKTK